MDKVLNLVGREGGSGSSYWKIVAEEGQGVTSYYPAVDENGNERSYSEFDKIEDYFQAKVEKKRLTVRYTVLGNPIAAEEEVSSLLGCHCMSVAPHTLDVYYATDAVVDEII